MLKTWSVGILYVVTAFQAGYVTLYSMLQTVNGGPWSWWYPIMLGASILLLVGGVHVVACRVKDGWLVVLAAALPLAMCGAFGGLPLRCWAFAVVVALVTWASLALASALKRTAITGLIATLTLAASSVPPSVRAFGIYFSPNPPNPNPATLLWLLAPWVLIIASIVVGIMLSTSSVPGEQQGG